MTVLEHLSELRKRLVITLVAVAIGSGFGWSLFDRVVDLVVAPARPYLTGPADGRLFFTSPLEAFTTRLKLGTYVGFALAFPVVLYQFWRFVSPGLERKEKRYAIPFVVVGMALFCSGVVFAYYTLPQALRFLISPAITGGAISPLLTAKAYIGFTMLYLISFGLAFEFPVVLMFLTLTRLVSSRKMGRYRRQVLVGIAVLAAVATPSVDILTMGVLTSVLYLMFEASILLSRLLKR
ncbi:MAG TPA: twin-arginine translocase subunit TatC [Actinomycetota bacterium]|nr:twin-arginine translocase subunit TatC [Actinomycetota bacterium]